MADLSKPMLKPRKPKMTGVRGEAWFYVGPKGLEVCVADRKGVGASISFTISLAQIARATQIIREYRKES